VEVADVLAEELAEVVAVVISDPKKEPWW